MCGIFGCISDKNVINGCFKGLEKLEYRGYDSSGIAYIKDNKITVNKSVGRIKNLQEKMPANLIANCAIMHTRWATHGAVNETNAHPHLSENNKIAVVHNGIIENFNHLKLKFNLNCKSQTDSEVIAQLLQKSKKKKNIEKLKEVCDLLIGSYALAVIFHDQPQKIYVAKHKSPVVVGNKNNASFVCSDINALSGFCDNAYILEDFEFAIITPSKIQVYDKLLNLINFKTVKITNEENNMSNKKFKHYMLKEIFEVPTAIKQTISNNCYFKLETILNKIKIEEVKNIILIGCGTAYHACLVGERLFNAQNICARSYIASEFRYDKIFIPKNTLAIFISQSGETADTLACVEKCNKLKIKTLAITNVKFSNITKLANQTIYTYAGSEIAVASTKAYNSQLTVLFLLNNFLKNLKKNNNFNKYYTESKKIISLTKNLLNKQNIIEIKKLAYKYKNCNKFFLIGRLGDGITAKEGALKLKEITYNQCEAYASGELKHGTIALIDKKSTVICFATNKNVLSKSLVALEEVKCRGAKTILITLESFNVDNFEFTKIIKLKKIPSCYAELVSIEFMQLFSYFLCIELGYDPDKPRNLAKSVTVE